MELFHSRLWGYDNLFQNSFKLNISDILHLEQYGTHKGVFRISNHPVSGVWFMGDVISVCIRERYTSYRVDDGTGCIRCVWWHNEGSAPSDVTQGCLVTVIGKINEYKETKQIYVSKIEKSDDSNQEVSHWLEVMRLRPLYLTPYTLPANRQRNLVHELKKALIVHLQNKEGLGVFTLEEITEECKSENMLNVNVLSSDYQCIDTLLTNVMDEMVRDCYFIYQRTNSNYTYLPDTDIIPSILEIFRKLNGESTGQSAILNILRRDYLHVAIYTTAGRLEHVLSSMVDQSLIYPVGDSQWRNGKKEPKYKLVD